jgi:uncharacterized protein (UPF0548 family)
VVGTGRELFATCAERLMTWQVQTGAGLTVVPGGARAEAGMDVRTSLRLGPFTFTAPCRVVYVVDEEDRKGFAYGTLAGHPERGEELFVVTLVDDVVTFEVVAFSRPARWWSRLGGPASRLVQRRITERYLRAAATG